MPENHPKAVFFDSKNTLFDWSGQWINATEKIIDKRGADADPLEVKLTWQRFLTGTMLRSAFGQYKEISTCLRESLDDALHYHGIDGDVDDATYMIETWDDVYPFPETTEALSRIQEHTDVIIFSNVETKYLEMMVDKMEDFDPDLLATMQDAQAIKPSPNAYRWVLEEMDLTKEEVLYCAGPIWDVNGAMAYGLQAAWVNRVGTEQPENRELQRDPEYEIGDLTELADLIEAGEIVAPA